jgi:hypothetical protein
MFAYVMDFKELSVQFEPAQLIASLNEAVNVFDEITNRFDVFKVETKADGSYMAAAGLFDRSQLIQQQQHEPKVINIPLTTISRPRTSYSYLTQPLMIMTKRKKLIRIHSDSIRLKSLHHCPSHSYVPVNIPSIPSQTSHSTSNVVKYCRRSASCSRILKESIVETSLLVKASEYSCEK